MESGEGFPKPEDVPLPPEETHMDDPLEIKPEDFPLPEDDPYETPSYNPKFNDFLQDFERYKTEEYKKGSSPSLETLKNNTLSSLKSMRQDIYKNLFEKYLSDDTERNKIIKNRNGYKPFDSNNQDVEDFINLSKNISQLEKGIYTEENKELMFVLGEDPSTPNKNLLKKILDFLKDKKYPFLFTLLAGTLIGLFVDVEKQLNKASKKIKEAIAKQLLKKVKDQLSLSLLKAQQKIIEATKKYLIILVIILVAIVYYKFK